MKGSKQLVREIINFYKINREGYPYELIYKLTQLWQVLEDVYSVSDITELQEVIDNIGDGAGTIFIAAGTHIVNTPIDIDGCGTLVIYGHGDNTVLQAAAGTTIFNITCVESLLIKTLKLDINNYNFLSPNTQAVIVNEGSNNIVGFSDVTIDGDGTNGIGIEFQSDNCYVDQCNITDCKKGIYINNSDTHIITNNIITGHADYGIHADTGNYLTIVTNKVNTNGNYGIYLDTITYSAINSNICNSNTQTGIYSDTSTYNIISSNSCSTNSENGIYLTTSSYNTISSNTCSNNDSNSITAKAGIYITTNSDYNTITGNSVNNNNNTGIGTGYGIYIATATCDENVIAANNVNGNDVDYQDSGTSTTVIYYVQNTDELQDAIDSIGSSAGIININSSFTVSTTIDIDGGGSYLIEGEGSNTVLTIAADITCFNIDTSRQCTLRNFKINASAYTAGGATQEIIDVNEDNNDLVILDNVAITGDGTNGYGIELNSNNCRIKNCEIDNINIGINVLSTNNIISGNNVNNCNTYGIQISSANTNNITTNIVDSNTTGIYISSSDYIILNGNSINSNTENGIELTGSDYATINGNSCVGNDSNTPNAQSGIYLNSDSNNNSIIGNTSLNNNNAGVGKGYGIYIGNANCDANIVHSNNISGNDITWKDIGTNSEFEYICRSASNIQDAIDSIAAKSGTISIVAGTIGLSATIDVDGGGSYIIEGNNDNTVIDCAGDRTAFNITNARNCILRNFKIDAADITTDGTEIIIINETSDNKIVIDNVNIYGDADKKGIGIKIESERCEVYNCLIDQLYEGIWAIDDTFELRIINNRITNTGYDPIVIFYTEDGIISNNLISGAGATNRGGIYSSGLTTSMLSDNTITGCNKGMKLEGCEDNTITGNILYSNAETGLFIDNSSHYNTISNNKVRDNSENGIYIGFSDYNTINGNVCYGNGSDTANPQAGIYIDDGSDNNVIIGNSSFNNNNAGAGTGYGLYIGTVGSDCDNNVLKNNSFSGNDVQWKDNGVNTEIEYICNTAQDIQDAIDSISAKTGTIIISSGTITVSTTIDVDGGGSYIIKGQGDGTVLTTSGDITCFSITSIKSFLFQNFKINASSLTTSTKPIIYVYDASDDFGTFDNITITGDGTNGYGIQIESNLCIINNCNIDNVNQGIRLDSSSYHTMSGNDISSCTIGIYVDGSGISLSNNYINGNATGISFASGLNNAVSDNDISGNTINGLIISVTSKILIIGNSFYTNQSNTGNPQAAIYIDNNSDNITVIGNTISGTSNAGVGTGYGLYIANANCDNNIVSSNSINGNDVDYLDNGTGTMLYADDTAYGVGWDGDLGTATKNAIYDEFVAAAAIFAAHRHDTHTLQLDGINSDGGAFPFTTTGTVTFNQAVTIQGLLTSDGLVPKGDLADSLGTASLTWLNLFVQDIKDAAGNVILSNDGAGNIDAIAPLSTNITFVGAQTVDGVDISSIVAFKTITGITNNVVADSLTDTLTFSAAGGLTIVGNAGTDTITFTNTITQYTDANAVSAVATADDYLKNDANDETSGDLTVANLITAGLVDGKDVSGLATVAEAHAYVEANALVITGGLQMSGVNITMAGAETVDGVDISAISITNMPTAVNNWKMYATNGAGAMTELAVGGANTFLIGNGVGAAPSFQAQPAPVAHVHDGDTLQLDGINSNGGAFAFATTGSIGVDMVNAGATVFSINNSGAGVASLDITGNITVSGTVDGKDVSGLATVAEAHAYVEANTLTMTQNITFNAGQLFDGQDVSAMATDLGNQATAAEAHAYVEANTLVVTGGLQMSGVNITMAGAETVDGVDVSALSITNMPTAVNNWKMYATNGTGIMTELVVGAAGTFLTGNGVGAAPSFQAQPAPVAHVHDGDTLQLDGINSNGGAFAFATTNSISVDMVNAGATVFSIDNSGAGVASLDVTGNITVSGTVDGVDIADRDHAKYTDANAQSAVAFEHVDSGTDFNSHSEQVKAGFHITGGGTITVDGSYRVGWTQRMLVIAAGRGTHFSTTGFFEINQPTSGVITAVGGGTANTWNASGIVITGWQSLYYILPIGSNNTSITANFRMVGYTSDLEIPDDWILIAKKHHEGGAEHVKFSLGFQLNASETWVQGTASMIKYTNAEALAYVNAQGLALAATKVITTQDADLTFTFGRAQIDSRFADYIVFSNRDMAGNGQWALAQHKLGDTFLNAPTGKTLNFNINNVFKMGMSASGLNMGIPIAMGANKITGMDDPAANQDAATKIYVDLRLLISEIDNIPVDGVVVAPISSNWAFDHAASPANVRHLTDAQIAALHTILDGYTKAEINALNAIGSGNKQWIQLFNDGESATIKGMRMNIEFMNIGSGIYVMGFGIPRPFQISDGINTYNLVITQTRFGMTDADGNNKIINQWWYGESKANPPVRSGALVTNATDYDAPAAVVWDHADITVGDVYRRMIWFCQVQGTTADNFDFAYVQVQYYYEIA